MACHLAGEKTAVATCGTAFGEDHIKIINRLFGQASTEPASVIFTFDPDAAGEKAALRVYSDTAKFNALTFVAVGPEGLDPSDLRQQRGDASITKMLESKKPLFEFVIRHRIAKFDLVDLDSRIAAARSAAPVIAELVDPALRSGYTRSLAEWVSLDVSEVSNIVALQGRAVRAENVSQMRTSTVEAPIKQDGPQQRLERQILEILVQRPQSFTPQQLRRITAAGLTSSEHQLVLSAASSISDQLGATDFANQLSLLVPDDQVGLIRELALANLPVRNDAELGKYSSGIVRGALMQALAREKTDLLAALKRIDSSANADQVAQIQQQLVELESERRALM